MPHHDDQHSPNEQGERSQFDVFAETMITGHASESDFPLPSKIGRFEVLSVLGAGSFGVVLRAKDEILGREVAIKVPKGDLSESAIESFLVEAKRLAQLQHPGIVGVFDVGREKNICYIVTEFLEGRSLKEEIASGNLSVEQGIQIVLQLADAIGHAHTRGIMHRDIKPANVILTNDGRCVLLDFGLAVNDLEAVRGEIAGTPVYMSPEQIRGQSHRIDGRTDIYAIGVILYEILTGRPPFRAMDRQELYRKIKHDPPQPIRQLNPSVSKELEQVCLSAIVKSIDHRPDTAGDFAEALRSVTQGQSWTPPTVHGTGDDFKVASSTPGRSGTKAVTLDSTNSVQGSNASTSMRRLKEAELRQISLVVASFDLTERELDPEQEHEVISNFAQVAADCAVQYGGARTISSGSDVELCFGFPTTYEDATARAVRCALELLKRVANHPHLPQTEEIYLVVHSGRAVAEETSQGVKVTGEVQKTSTRLTTQVDAGRPFITNPVKRQVEHIFEFADSMDFRIRGLSEPVRLYEVIRERTHQVNRVELVDPANLSPLVGRDTELSILKDRWEQAAESLSQIVLLIGEAGLGKSRLIREVREYISKDEDEPDIIELRCSQNHETAGFYPMVMHLQQLLGFDDLEGNPAEQLVSIKDYLNSLDLDSERNVGLLASLLSVSDGPETGLTPQKQKELTVQLLHDIVVGRSDSHPVLFIVEDLHWVDPSLLQLLAQFVEEFQRRRMLLIFTFRPEFETPWKSKPHQTQIALNRLTRRQVKKMMQNRLTMDVSDEVVSEIVERADGIPLFIEEFSNVLGETVLEPGQKLTPEVIAHSIPTSLQDLLISRIDRLQCDQEVLQLASVIGREFSYKMLRAVSDLPDEQLQLELTKLVDAEVLFQNKTFPEAAFIFKHALLQDSAYNSILTKSRQAYHGRIARALEKVLPEIARQQPELMAHHFTEAEEFEKGIEYWLKAGQRSQALCANDEALDHLKRGLILIADQPASAARDGKELEFQLTRTAVLIQSRGYGAEEVFETQQRSRELCESIGKGAPLFHVLHVIWELHLIRQNLDECSKYADQLIDLAHSAHEGDSGFLTEAHWTQNCTSYYLANFEVGLEHFRKGIELYDIEKSKFHAAFAGHNSGIAIYCFSFGMTWITGYPDQAFALVDDCARLDSQLEHPHSTAVFLYHKSLLEEYCRLPDAARSTAKAEIKLCSEQGYPFWLGLGEACLGAAALLDGELEEAVAMLRQGIAHVEETGAIVTLAHYYGVLAEALWKQRKMEDAQLELGKAFHLMHDTKAQFAESELNRLKGLMCADENAKEAEGYLRHSIEAARRQKAKSWELRALMSLCRLQQNHDLTISIDELDACLNWFTEGIETPDLIDAREMCNSMRG